MGSVRVERRGLVSSVLSAGAIIGVIEVVIALSFGALVFGGMGGTAAGAGVGLALASGAVMLLVVGVRTTRPGTAASIQDVPVVFLAVAASAIAGSTSDADARLATTVAVGVLACLATGALFLASGALRLGRLVRFLPYSVVGGFLAGTGIVLLQGGLEVAAAPEAGWLASLGDGDVLARWALAVAVLVALVTVLERSASVYALPAVLVGVVVAFHVARLLLRVPADAAAGWVTDVGGGALWQWWGGVSPAAVDVTALTGQLPTVAVLVVFSTIALLLQVSGIEVLTQQDLELDRELRVAGLANLGAGVVGAFPGYHALSLSALSERTGARSRAASVVAAGVVALVLLGGGVLVSLLPTFLLGGLLLLLGYDFVSEWLFRVRHRVTAPEYAIVVGIACVIVLWGFLPGVGAGMVAAVATFAVAYSRVDPIRLSGTLASVSSTVDHPAASRRVLRRDGESVLVLELHGYLFFGTAAQVVERCRARCEEQARRAVVIDLSRVTGADSSASQSFVRLQQQLRASDARLVLAGVDGRTRRTLEDGGLQLGTEGALAFPDLDHALEWAESVVLSAAGIERRERIEPRALIERVLGEEAAAHRLMTYLRPSALAAGDVLVEAGTRSGAVHLIERGLLDVRAGDGRRVRRLGPGSVVGEVSLLTGGPHGATVVAATDASVWSLDDAAWRRMRARNRRLAVEVERALGVVVAERLVDTIASLESVRR